MLDEARKPPAKTSPSQVITYSAVISACEKHGRWEEALLVLVDMQRLGAVGVGGGCSARSHILMFGIAGGG